VRPDRRGDSVKGKFSKGEKGVFPEWKRYRTLSRGLVLSFRRWIETSLGTTSSLLGEKAYGEANGAGLA